MNMYDHDEIKTLLSSFTTHAEMEEKSSEGVQHCNKECLHFNTSNCVRKFIFKLISVSLHATTE